MVLKNGSAEEVGMSTAGIERTDAAAERLVSIGKTPKNHIHGVSSEYRGEVLQAGMFRDKRSKKLIALAHCILNQNSISDGTADFPSQFKEVVELIMENDIGIVQLPCPELCCLGIERGDANGGSRELLRENSRIRRLMEKRDNREKLRKHARQIIHQIEEYRKHGFDIIGLVGINRSPSCGIETTSIRDREEKGKDVFMELMVKELAAKRIPMNATGVKTSEREESLRAVRELIAASRGKGSV